ncbi:MAG: hypothetical protein J4224_00965 [Candidatus Diapherotrites archaeon]|uniref:Uncharacterized protein n=1 Tax=Candidatus Iainarchaeum sp. TaxID=3101447 RepID=A0A7J4ITW7_9ARCH|nr:MAG: hypothetical protein QT03_C0001G0748 [archaeon GW2011_AR10]MBS3058980.1 hypothetical protein [Candidatus Diapherotrites archaeon]HIH08933.1 hypothetical protein [Candidatus Diapherotrites archaeon]
MLFTILLSLTEIWNDFNLIIKIFVVMTIYSWVRNHVEGWIGWVVFGIITFFVVFDLWAIFGSVYVVYMLLMFGISQVLIDFFFISAGRGGHEEMESPVSSGADLAARQQHIAARQAGMMKSFFKR